MTQPEDYLAKADRSLASASVLLIAGYPDFAVCRAYYGAFYVASALLATHDLAFRRHGSIIGQFGLYFARPGIINPRFHQLLRDGFKLRQEADYGARWTHGDDVAMKLIAGGRDFLAAARTHLETA
jgi:uncharacterized protein (UPF0332 family)